jgi:hypothetical protein
MSSTGIATRSYIEPEAEALGRSSIARDIDAQTGSDRLATALHKLFARFEAEHGLQPGAGKLLLPAGWNGWDR